MLGLETLSRLNGGSVKNVVTCTFFLLLSNGAAERVNRDGRLDIFVALIAVGCEQEHASQPHQQQ